MTANRVVAIVAFLTGLAGAIAGVAKIMPTGAQSTALAIAGGLGAIATCLHFMLGSQKSEALSVQKELQAAGLEFEKLVHNPAEIPAEVVSIEQKLERLITTLEANPQVKAVIDNPQA